MSSGKDLALGFAEPALLCSAYAWGCPWHTRHCGQTESSLFAAPSMKQHARTSEKEKKRKKERMCPHGCDIVPPDWFAHHDNRADGCEWGGGWGSSFSAGHNTERHGCLNLSDIPVVNGSNPWISMNWLSGPCSRHQKCPTHIKSSRSFTSPDLLPASCHIQTRTTDSTELNST